MKESLKSFYSEFKNEVKVNNMAIGIFKNTLIYILLEENPDKMSEMMDKFQQEINRFMVPVKPDRQNKRNANPKNRHHVNQRKTF